MSIESTLGAYLREGREQSGLSADDVASTSGIASQLVRALEVDRFDLLLGPVYVRRFIRAFCQQVALDVDTALRIYAPIAVSTPGPSLRPAPVAPGLGPGNQLFRRLPARRLLRRSQRSLGRPRNARQGARAPSTRRGPGRPEGAPVPEETLPLGAVLERRSTGRFRVSVGRAAGVEIELGGERCLR
jgi:Helix-turn-helix domain